MRCLSLASLHWTIGFGIVVCSPEPEATLQVRMLRSHSSILETAYAGNHINNDLALFGVVSKVRSSDGVKETPRKKSHVQIVSKAAKVGTLPSLAGDRFHAKKEKAEAKDEMKLTKNAKEFSKSPKTSDKPSKSAKPKTPKGCRRLDSKTKPRSSKKAKSAKSSSKQEYSTFGTNSTEHLFGSPSDKSSSKSGKASHTKMTEESADNMLVDCEPVFDETPAPVSPAPTPAPTPAQSFPPFATELILESDERIVLEPYHLFFSIEQTRIPLLSDYEPLTDLTDKYLNRYFGTILTSMPQVQFKATKTELSGSEFRLAQPVRLDFVTTLYFAASSPLPEETELQAFLAGSFEGINGEKFAGVVASSLDLDNIFVSTSTVVYATKDATTRTQRVAAGFAMYALNAVVVVLVVVGLQSKRTKAARTPTLKGADYLTVTRSNRMLEERTVQSATSMHEIAFSSSGESSASEDSGYATSPGFRIIGKPDTMNVVESDSASFESEGSAKIIQRLVTK